MMTMDVVGWGEFGDVIFLAKTMFKLKFGMRYSSLDTPAWYSLRPRQQQKENSSEITSTKIQLKSTVNFSFKHFCFPKSDDLSGTGTHTSFTLACDLIWLWTSRA